MNCAPIVTGHAIERYVERVARGIDARDARTRIISALESHGSLMLIAFAGDARYKLKAGGITYCFVGRFVTTCYPA